MKKKLKYIVKVVLLSVLAFFVFGLSLLFFIKSRNNIVVTSLSYSESSDVNYRVYLKENSFFEKPYYDKKELINNNQTIISKLIKNIDLNYTYNFSANDFVTGKYTYQILATIDAKTSDGSKNYWSKVYELTDKNEVDVKNSSSFSIIENVNIDYEMYNSLYNEFKEENKNLSSDGNLTIKLVIEGVVNNSNVDKTINLSPKLSLELPLSEAATEISIDTKESDTKKTFDKKEKSSDIKYTVYFVSSILLFIVSVFVFLKIVLMSYKHRIKFAYDIKLRRILSTYDGIIVNVSSLPDLDKFEIINVKSFDELIDAHSEVRMPINYYSNNTSDIFILINNSMLWYYDLKEINGAL